MEGYNKSNNSVGGYGVLNKTPGMVHRTFDDEELRRYGIAINSRENRTTSGTQQIQKNSLEKDLDSVRFLIGDDSVTKSGQRKETPTGTRSRAKEMQEKSTHGAYCKNTRQKTRVDKKWQRIAVAVGVAASMTVGGLLVSPLDEAITYVSNKWALHQMATEFEKNTEKEFVKTTFTGDRKIDYSGISRSIESDGEFSNEDLLIAVDTLGEVATNEVLKVADNPPAPDVQTYMLDHNINSLKDWRNKTVTAMGLQNEILENQSELNAMFGENNQNSYQNANTEGYGNK